MGGPVPPHFSKSWSLRFAQKCNKIGGGGGSGRSGRSVKKWSLRFLKSKQRMAFSRIGSIKVSVSKKCLNTARRDILSQSRMHIFKTFPGVLPTHFNIPCYLSLNMRLAIGIPVCCNF